MVQVPLIVDRESGVNDYLDREGAHPIAVPHLERPRRHRSTRGRPGRHQVEADGAAPVRLRSGKGLCTDMRAVRKDYFLDHDHSAYVDQWDWER